MPAQEQIVMFLTHSGITRPVGAAQDTLLAWIRTRALDFDQPKFVKFLDQLTAHISNRPAQSTLSVEIYGSDDEDGPFTLLQTVNLSSNDPVNLDVPGQRYYKFRFIDSSVSERWRLHDVEIYGELGGDEF